MAGSLEMTVSSSQPFFIGFSSGYSEVHTLDSRKQEGMSIPILNPLHVGEQCEPTEQAVLNNETSSWPEEVLVPDARSGLTPAQFVDQKLQAMLGRNYRGLFHQRTGRPGNRRRTAAE